MSGDWEFYLARVNDAVSSIFVDLSARAGAPEPSRPHLVWIWVELRSPREDGLSSSEEATQLGEIEDAITPAVERSLKARFVGRITGTGRREFYFYAAHCDGLQAVVDSTMGGFPHYSVELGAQPDPGWSQYLGLLYPRELDLQCIKNRHVVDALRAHGDALTAARPVTHWIYFRTQADRSGVVPKLRALRFNPQESGAEGDRPYGLRIERVDHVDEEAIDSVVVEIYEAIEGANAQYDGWECPITT